MAFGACMLWICIDYLFEELYSLLYTARYCNLTFRKRETVNFCILIKLLSSLQINQNIIQLFSNKTCSRSLTNHRGLLIFMHLNHVQFALTKFGLNTFVCVYMWTRLRCLISAWDVLCVQTYGTPVEYVMCSPEKKMIMSSTFFLSNAHN